MWGTGGMTGHSALAVWEGDTLYICESTDENPSAPCLATALRRHPPPSGTRGWRWRSRPSPTWPCCRCACVGPWGEGGPSTTRGRAAVPRRPGSLLQRDGVLGVVRGRRGGCVCAAGGGGWGRVAHCPAAAVRLCSTLWVPHACGLLPWTWALEREPPAGAPRGAWGLP